MRITLILSNLYMSKIFIIFFIQWTGKSAFHHTLCNLYCRKMTLTMSVKSVKRVQKMYAFPDYFYTKIDTKHLIIKLGWNLQRLRQFAGSLKAAYGSRQVMCSFQVLVALTLMDHMNNLQFIAFCRS